ncbi:hypothetical protein BKA70DRAFT_1371111 [Coprinopsis sp. MPI-PUGE-AT-0042]|nr:hypothetical protein BKA70DRAFT_1371111 [Coprinopsis sp. MPI-PUGE-AT-0042]
MNLISDGTRSLHTSLPFQSKAKLPPFRHLTQHNSRPDPFYGHEPMAHMRAGFITHLSAFSEYPPTTTHVQAKPPHSVLCDDTHSFSSRDINQMEREMCSYLDWELTLDGPLLSSFDTAMRADLAQDKKTYPSYPLTAVSKHVSKSVTSQSAAPTPKPDLTNAIRNFGQHRHASPTRSTNNSSVNYSTSTYPASSVSLQTPVGPEKNTAQMHGIDDAPFTVVEDAPPGHPLKGLMFAFALPSKW